MMPFASRLSKRAAGGWQQGMRVRQGEGEGVRDRIVAGALHAIKHTGAKALELHVRHGAAE